MSQVEQVPSAEGLFTETPDGPRLLGSLCGGCHTPYFPSSALCHNPDCESPDMRDTHFGPRGTLFTYAIQNYAPPPPVLWDEPFTPYAVGLVDLPEGLRVLGRIFTDEPTAVAIGGEVELVIEPLCTSESGEQILSWQFKPL